MGVEWELAGGGGEVTQTGVVGFLLDILRCTLLPVGHQSSCAPALSAHLPDRPVVT